MPKRQILSFASDFSKQQLTTMIKGLTRWIIDQARSHDAASVGAGKPVESQSTEQDRIQYRPTTFRFYFAACIFTRCRIRNKEAKAWNRWRNCYFCSCTYCYSITDYSSVPEVLQNIGIQASKWKNTLSYLKRCAQPPNRRVSKVLIT